MWIILKYLFTLSYYVMTIKFYDDKWYHDYFTCLWVEHWLNNATFNGSQEETIEKYEHKLLGFTKKIPITFGMNTTFFYKKMTLFSRPCN